MAIVAKEVYPDLLDSDGFVPIPLHVYEYYERGQFNQTLELAKVLRRETNLPIIWALVKTRINSQRKIKSISARRKAVKGLYEVEHTDKVESKRLVIIDDIFTSGATCSEAAKMLKSANAKSVRVFVAGRSNFV